MDEHTCVVRFGADSLDRIALELVALGTDFTLDGPPELLDHLRVVAERLLRPAGQNPVPEGRGQRRWRATS
ncbi:hypothetical protein [Streptosporangium sp. NPDC000396]|uniref:hypothetical protein n=1 Tax=Streptosporangium sp. NPDC000396 TaxID=3366185 RepID=UPI0036774D3E